MIIAIGDIHGKFREMKIKMRSILYDHFDEEDQIHFVQVGDFGLGFDNPRLDYYQLLDIENDLVFKKANLWIIRGNHDNPYFWGDGAYKFSNIHFVKDDTRLRLDNKECYFAGGSVSIDRIDRTHGVSYWGGEIYQAPELIFNSNEVLPIDILFTHDVYQPVSTFNFLQSDLVKRWCEKDKNLYGDLVAQQYELEKLYTAIKETNKNFKWYHGHYHESTKCYYDDSESFTSCLNELEFKEILY
jgi:hypothetical protein